MECWSRILLLLLVQTAWDPGLPVGDTFVMSQTEQEIIATMGFRFLA